MYAAEARFTYPVGSFCGGGGGRKDAMLKPRFGFRWGERERGATEASESDAAEDLISTGPDGKPTNLPFRQMQLRLMWVARSPKGEGGGRQSCLKTKRLGEGAGRMVGSGGYWWVVLGMRRKAKRQRQREGGRVGWRAEDGRV